MPSRREFIKGLSLLSGVTLIQKKAFSFNSVSQIYQVNDDEMVLIAIAEAIFPEGRGFNLSIMRKEFIERMKIFKNNLIPVKKIQMKVGLFILQYFPLFFSFHLKKLTSMDINERREYLKSWENSIFYLKRLIFKGIKMFICLVYFSFEEIKAELSYRVPCPISGKPIWEER